MNKNKKKEIKRTVDMGKWNYIFTYGIRWAMLCGFLLILFDKFILDKKITEFSVAFDVIIWGIAGLIIGLWGWNNANKKLEEK